MKHQKTSSSLSLIDKVQRGVLKGKKKKHKVQVQTKTIQNPISNCESSEESNNDTVQDAEISISSEEQMPEIDQKIFDMVNSSRQEQHQKLKIGARRSGSLVIQKRGTITVSDKKNDKNNPGSCFLCNEFQVKS